MSGKEKLPLNGKNLRWSQAERRGQRSEQRDTELLMID